MADNATSPNPAPVVVPEPDPASAAPPPPFESICINSSAESLREFEGTFSEQEHPGRRLLLKNLEYTIHLPPISRKRLKKFQSTREAAANSAAITQALLDLFSRLAVWDAGDIAVTLNTTPYPKPDYSKLESNHFGKRIWGIRDTLKYICLDDAILPSSALPVVRSISNINLSSIPLRLHPSVLALLLRALPGAKQVSFACYMPTRRLMIQRREIRYALAQTLRDAPLESVEVLRIFLDDNRPLQECFPLEVLTNVSGQDDLSLAVRHIFQLPKIKEVHLLGGEWILSPEAFQSEDPFGGSLEWISIDLSVVTPDGKWLITGDIDEANEYDERPSSGVSETTAAFDSGDSDTSDYIHNHAWEEQAGDIPQFLFRFSLDADTITPVLKFMALAVRKMPALRYLGLELHNSCILCLRYFAAGVGDESRTRQPPWEREFMERYADRPRWLISTDMFDEYWSIRPELVGAMEQGGGRIQLACGKIFQSSGNGKTLEEVPKVH